MLSNLWWRPSSLLQSLLVQGWLGNPPKASSWIWANIVQHPSNPINLTKPTNPIFVASFYDHWVIFCHLSPPYLIRDILDGVGDNHYPHWVQVLTGDVKHPVGNVELQIRMDNKCNSCKPCIEYWIFWRILWGLLQRILWRLLQRILTLWRMSACPCRSPPPSCCP